MRMNYLDSARRQHLGRYRMTFVMLPQATLTETLSYENRVWVLFEPTTPYTSSDPEETPPPYALIAISKDKATLLAFAKQYYPPLKKHTPTTPLKALETHNKLKEALAQAMRERAIKEGWYTP